MKIKINPLWKELEVDDEMNLITQLYDAYESKADFSEIIIFNSPCVCLVMWTLSSFFRTQL